jgi:folylpolyglutamate synthase/dihydropteroate synthase
MTYTTTTKPITWDKQYIIENLPTWIYTDNKEPESVTECKAKISALQYTIKDIELQIEVRDLELKTGNSRHTNSFDYDKWKTQALRAKQTHMYLLNAYTYWLILNERETTPAVLDQKLNTLINLLIEEPVDFQTQLEKLL